MITGVEVENPYFALLSLLVLYFGTADNESLSCLKIITLYILLMLVCMDMYTLIIPPAACIQIP